MLLRSGSCCPWPASPGGDNDDDDDGDDDDDNSDDNDEGSEGTAKQSGTHDMRAARGSSPKYCF